MNQKDTLKAVAFILYIPALAILSIVALFLMSPTASPLSLEVFVSRLAIFAGIGLIFLAEAIIATICAWFSD